MEYLFLGIKVITFLICAIVVYGFTVSSLISIAMDCETVKPMKEKLFCVFMHVAVAGLVWWCMISLYQMVVIGVSRGMGIS